MLALAKKNFEVMFDPLPDIASCSGTLERAGHQTQACCKQGEHDYDVEKTRLTKIDLKIREDAYEDNDRSRTGQNPTGDRLAVKEQESQSYHKRNQSQAKCVRSPPAPVTAGHLDLVHYQVAAGHCKRGSEYEHSKSTGCTARTLKSSRSLRAVWLLLWFCRGHAAKRNIEQQGTQS